MNYKKIIPNREIRLKILGLTEFIPDKLMIKLQYRIATGRKLNIKKPTRFTEKLQWYKLNYKNPLMTQCADKYEVRKYVESKGFKDILVTLYGIYENSEEIIFDHLPNKFVIKTTNGSHTNLLIKDKSRLDIISTLQQLDNWMKKKTVKAGREWPYYNIKPRIICEKYLESDNDDLIDYKFICFDGKVECVFVNAERTSDEGMIFGIYDNEFNKLQVKRKGLRDATENNPIFKKPKNFERMIEISEKLSEDFPHVRIDLYNIHGNIYFGEMTFFHGSGYVMFEPDNYDLQLGEKFNITRKYLS